MLESTQDLLYIVLALAILWVTVFLCWLLYQAARVLRNANRIVESLMHKLELIVDAVEFMKHKVDDLTSGVGTVQRLLGGAIERFIVSKVSKKMTADEPKVKRKARATRKRGDS